MKAGAAAIEERHHEGETSTRDISRKVKVSEGEKFKEDN